VAANGGKARSYRHPEADSLMRPDVGTQAQFKKKKEPKKYSYDSSLSPTLEYDGQNYAREQGEALLKQILDTPGVDLPEDLRQQITGSKGDLFVGAMGEALDAADKSIRTMKAAADKLKRISKPFLNWAGKAERLSFDVPTLPMFVHERLSTKAILETLKGHKRDKQIDMFDLFGDPGHSITDQILKAYEHRDKWVNRMILGDSLVVMNSLLQYEGMGGKVQMIYMDPPYGVKFGSNFQPFVRKRDVSHGDDEDMTREPEMVQAYRDTWELGLHSYLTYMRDRLTLSRELLSQSGSIFVQISDENIHHVRELMDEVFSADNFCGLVAFRTTGGQSTALLSTSTDFLLWYAKDKGAARTRFHNPTTPKRGGSEASGQYTLIEPGDFSADPRSMTDEELEGTIPVPEGWRILAHDTLYSQGSPSDPEDRTFTWRDRSFTCPPNTHWKPGVKSGGVERLAKANRLMLVGNTLRYKRYVDDFPVYLMDNVWNDTAISGFARKKQYAVETSPKVVQRCLMMTTDPGDLVFDPTCGSGTTAYVAELWGRRWITTDVSRVPLALARQRVLTATYPYHELKDEKRGPAGGFVYQRKQNNKGEEVGGIVPHITLRSIAHNEPPDEEVLVDRPEQTSGVTRVTGPFCVESTIPAASDTSEPRATSQAESGEGGESTFIERMLEILRKSPILHTGDNRTLTLKNIRPPAKSLTLSAEGVAVNGDERNVAFVFGPENGAITERLVYDAAREANLKAYAHLFVIGFAIEAKARMFVQNCNDVVGIPATYVQATTDLTMSDLLKTMRSSEIFSVCGLPDVKLHRDKVEGSDVYKVELLGLDVFDPVTMQAKHYRGEDAAEQDKVPAWFLDTDYNGLCFHVSQAFFPRTAAWDSLKRALKGIYEDSVWDHLAGTISEQFEPGEHKQIAVKVVDDRGNELLVVKALSDAVKGTAKR
jgi:adenine-specific DNA-methyltransferase